VTIELVAPALDAAAWAQDQFGISLEPAQVQVLGMGRKRGILNCARQWGKTTALALKVAHRVYFYPETEVLVLAPTERQSGQLVTRARSYLRQLGIRTKGDGLNKISAVLPNGSRIAALPNDEDTIRGFTASLILIDEAARVPDALYHAALPFLATSDGELWLASTPMGKRGFFYDEWVNGGAEEWLRVTARATECSRYSPQFLAAERRRGESRFREEYLCEFVQQEGAMFDEADVRRCLDDHAPMFDAREGRFG
jgi:hypothetical protein